MNANRYSVHACVRAGFVIDTLPLGCAIVSGKLGLSSIGISFFVCFQS